MAKTPKTPLKPETRLVTSGRDPKAYYGFVNPPVYHASTVLYPTAEDQVAHRARYHYGRRGTPTSEALEAAIGELEGAGCAGVALLPSGLAAIATALLSVAAAGDHILVTDSVYRPTRNFCNGVLNRFGVTATYYDPLIGAGIADLFKPNTKAVFVEAPGSQSFEMQDIPAIAQVAHAKGALVLMDNTWASPLYFRAFEKGVDLSIQAGTKYIGGHSDIMFGTVSANAATHPKLKETMNFLGLCAGPDDIYLALRGLRTLAVRLARHHESGLRVARWLEQRAEVQQRSASGPAEQPGHAIWQRDFTGASGLFSVVLKPMRREGGLRLHGRACAVRHGIFLGRLREPGDPLRLRRVPHGNDMDAGRADAAFPYRPGERRRPGCRSRARLCGNGGGAIEFQATAPCPPPRSTNCRLRK